MSTCAGNSAPSQAPHAQTATSASSVRPSSSRTRSPSGVATARTTSAPCAAARRASARVARCARSTPASGSCSRKASPPAPKLGKKRSPSAGSSRAQGIPCVAHGRGAGRLEPVLRVRHPDEPALDHQLLAALALELAPERAGAPRGRRVRGVGAVPAADQPRLAAGGRARVAGVEPVDERDRHAVARELPRERGPERARTDDHRAVHRTREPSQVRRSSARTSRPSA